MSPKEVRRWVERGAEAESKKERALRVIKEWEASPRPGGGTTTFSGGGPSSGGSPRRLQRKLTREEVATSIYDQQKQAVSIGGKDINVFTSNVMAIVDHVKPSAGSVEEAQMDSRSPKKDLLVYRNWNPHLDAHPRKILDALAYCFYKCPPFHPLNQATEINIDEDPELAVERSISQASGGGASPKAGGARKGFAARAKALRSMGTRSLTQESSSSPLRTKKGGAAVAEGANLKRTAYLALLSQCLDPFIKVGGRAMMWTSTL